MSSALRAKMLNELTGKHVLSRLQVGKFFDKGEIRIERRHWDQTFNNALIQAAKKENRIPDISEFGMPDVMWKAFRDYLLKQSPFRTAATGGGGILVRYHVRQAIVTNTLLLIPISRGKQKNGRPYTGNIDDRAQKDIKLATQTFWNSRAFKSNVIKVFKKTKTEQVHEHGATGEQDFIASGTPGGQGSMQAPGAQGTVIDQRIIKIIAESATGEFNKTQWFSLFFEVVHAKWADLFGYDSKVTQQDTAETVKGEVIINSAVVPADSSFNPGNIDNQLRDEFIAFLTDPITFRKEAKRLVTGMTDKKADALFSDSPPPSKRMEDAAIKLAAAGVLDKLSEKIIKKEKKVGRPKGSKKRGRPTTAKRKGGRTSTTRKNAKVTKRNRGQQQNAIQQSPIALKEIINAKLPDELLKQMQLPKLRNRTGRFRNSAQVTNVMVGPRGGTHIEYTYMKNPYQTFEPGGRQGSVNRDPRRLIGGTVREIAQELMGKRFVKVRSV